MSTILNPYAPPTITPVTTGGNNVANNHGMLLRNGPITTADNTVNIGYAFSASAIVFAWLKPGEAVSLAPADCPGTNSLYLISADGSSTVPCWLQISG